MKELKLCDKWAESCVPSGGAVVNPDPVGRRNGQGKGAVSALYGTDVVVLTMLYSS